MRTLVFLIALFHTLENRAQHLYTPKNESFVEIGLGQSFPSFIQQNNWKAALYGAGNAGIGYARWLQPNWRISGTVGIWSYALRNRISFDYYTLDFSSPYCSAGLRYYKQLYRTKGVFFQLNPGVQLAYRGFINENHTNYDVLISSNHNVYPFLLGSVGIRKTQKKRLKGHKYRYSFEFAAFARINGNRLGTAIFTESNQTTVLNPKGDVIGITMRYIIPFGKKRLKHKVLKENKPFKRPEDSTLMPL